MLVAAELVTEAQVKEALGAQKRTGQRLGETLVSMGYVTEGQMTQVLSNQLSIPWVNLYHVDFSRELLGLVPTEVAERNCLVPVYVRHVRRQGDTLYVAMEDPLNVAAMQEVADGSGLPVKPMVASPTDIRNAIRVYYLGLPARGGGPARARASERARDRADRGQARHARGARAEARRRRGAADPLAEARRGGSSEV